MQYLFAWIVFAVAAGSIAKSRNRRAPLWAVLGLLTGPFAILIVALLPPAEESAPE